MPLAYQIVFVTYNLVFADIVIVILINKNIYKIL